MTPPTLDAVFWALSDPTRRSVIERLTQGPATITELAAPHGMSLPGFMKHLRVLEDAGLLAREKAGRSVRCELAPQALEEATVWLQRYEQFWNQRLDALGRFLYYAEETKSWPTPKPTPGPASSSPAATKRPSKKSGAPGPSRRR